MQSGQSVSRDIVAIFHTSFHPTKGNIVDWCLKATDDLSIDGVEFNTLPSGLHLVDRDVVYFTKGVYPGVSVFRRLRTSDHGQRGFRLSALGVLLAQSLRPRPWSYVETLNTLLDRIYTSVEQRDDSTCAQTSMLESFSPTGDWEILRAFFEDRVVQYEGPCGTGQWKGWHYELDNPVLIATPSTATLHLSHLLRILGPSAVTLYKHVLGRRRILIYTLPPVEAACSFCYVAADMCFEVQCPTSCYASKANSTDTWIRNGRELGSMISGVEGDTDIWQRPPLKGRSQGGIRVLGMVTLSDLDKIQQESKTGRGWIACTTDAIFLEKPSYYDLMIDLTTSTSAWPARPTLYLSKPTRNTSSLCEPPHRLSLIRFTWGDARLWAELNQSLQLDSEATERCFTCCHPTLTDPAPPHGVESNHSHAGLSAVKSSTISPWTDVWRMYEEVCLLCASLWIGAWRSNPSQPYSTTNSHGSEVPCSAVRLEGDDDLFIHSSFTRTAKPGIQHPLSAGSNLSSVEETPNVEGMKRTDWMSLGLGLGLDRSANEGCAQRGSMSKGTSSSNILEASPDLVQNTSNLQLLQDERFKTQVRMTLALLQTFHANACFQLSKLADLLPLQQPASASRETSLLVDVLSAAEVSRSPQVSEQGQHGGVIYLTPRDMQSFELSPLSPLDAHYLEWLAEEYGGGRRVVVRRDWKDLISMVLGFR